MSQLFAPQEVTSDKSQPGESDSRVIGYIQFEYIATSFRCS